MQRLNSIMPLLVEELRGDHLSNALVNSLFYVLILGLHHNYDRRLNSQLLQGETQKVVAGTTQTTLAIDVELYPREEAKVVMELPVRFDEDRHNEQFGPRFFRTNSESQRHILVQVVTQPFADRHRSHLRKVVTLFIRTESKLLLEHVKGEIVVGHRKCPLVLCLPAYTCIYAPLCFLR